MTTYRDGVGRWRWHIQHQHRRYTGRGYPNRRAATAAAEEKRRQLTAGAVQAYRTWTDLVTAYLREQERTASAKWVRQERTKLAKWFSEWSKLPPHSITPAHVLQRLQAIEAAGNGPRSINEYRKIAHAVFSFAVRLGALASNPVDRVRKVPEPVDPITPISTADLRKLLVASPLWLRRFLTVQATTGARWVQIAQLRRQDVHHDHIVLTNRKGGRERILRQFLTTHAAEAISAQLAEHTSEYVWPGKRRPSLSYNTALKAIQTACRRAEIPEHSYHRVRYWAGATMVGQGFSNRVVGRFLGHSTTAVTERYMYVEDAELRRVAERLSSALGAVDLDGATAGATRADVDGVQRG